jgi:hypothetical protein
LQEAFGRFCSDGSVITWLILSLLLFTVLLNQTTIGKMSHLIRMYPYSQYQQDKTVFDHQIKDKRVFIVGFAR